MQQLGRSGPNWRRSTTKTRQNECDEALTKVSTASAVRPNGVTASTTRSESARDLGLTTEGYERNEDNDEMENQ